jgi:hypothetical protein
MDWAGEETQWVEDWREENVQGAREEGEDEDDEEDAAVAEIGVEGHWKVEKLAWWFFYCISDGVNAILF